MLALTDITFYLLLVFGTVFLIGIIRPDFVVFWSRTKSRGQVMAIYGGITVLTFIVWGISSGQLEDTRKSRNDPKEHNVGEPAR